MAELTEQQKQETVLMLARFVRPMDVVRQLKEDHGIDASVQQIVQYDPTRPSFNGVEKWQIMFEAARDEYVNNVAVIPIAQGAFRLNELMKLYDGAINTKNRVLAASLLEQAAKEAGGVFSNVRNLNVNSNDEDLTNDERRAMLAELFDRSLGKEAQARVNAPGTITEQ